MGTPEDIAKSYGLAYPGGGVNHKGEKLDRKEYFGKVASIQEPIFPTLDFILWTCTHSLVTAETAYCVESLHRSTPMRFHWSFIMYDALIGRSRSMACTEFLRMNEAPYLIFLDDDITFKADDVMRILEQLHEGKDVIGGLYATGGGKRLAHRGWNGRLVIDGKAQEIEYLSTGFMGISRDILLRVRDTLPLLHQNSPEGAFYPFFESGSRPEALGGIYISEDWDFCEKVRAVGGKTWAHTGVMLGHCKRQIVDCEQAIQNNIVPKVRVNEMIWFDLGLYLNKEPKALFDKWAGSTAMMELAESWNRRNKKAPVEEFYKDNEQYLFDLCSFNTDPDYLLRMNPLKDYNDGVILDIGCGIGTLCFYLAGGNKKVVGYDINKVVLDFAEFRRKKMNWDNVSFTDQLPELGQFDLVTATDVLEHLPGEELVKLLNKLGHDMKKGAKLYHYTSTATENLPMHYNHEKDYFRWLEEAGFTNFDSHWAIKS